MKVMRGRRNRQKRARLNPQISPSLSFSLSRVVVVVVNNTVVLSSRLEMMTTMRWWKQRTNERKFKISISLSLRPPNDKSSTLPLPPLLLLFFFFFFFERERCVFLRVHCNKSPHKTKCKSARGDTCLGFRCFGRSFSLFFLNFFSFFCWKFLFSSLFRAFFTQKKENSLFRLLFALLWIHTHTHIKDHHGAFCDDDDMDDAIVVLFIVFVFDALLFLNVYISSFSRDWLVVLTHRGRESTDFFFGFFPVNF